MLIQFFGRWLANMILSAHRKYLKIDKKNVNNTQEWGEN